MNNPAILALDFDGVICDGLLEYLDSTSKAYQQIWQLESLDLSKQTSQSFYQLRPVIETGWEMPVLLRAIILNYDPQQILDAWHLVRDEIVERENLDRKRCGQALDGVRDRAIKSDLAAWLGLHRFYDGILAKLNRVLASETKLYIVTTKERRFVKQLLQQQGIELPDYRIIGKEVKRPKDETIRLISKQEQIFPADIWFIEDRIQALELVHQQQDLKEIKLFLADWGYNTSTERQLATQKDYVQLLSLSQFTI